MDDNAERPKSLKFKEPVIDVAFSPTSDLVASSLITGHIFIHQYSLTGNTRQHRLKPHRKSCRSLCFSGDGLSLYTASKDKSWQSLDVTTGAELSRIEEAHDKAINIVKYVNEQIIATGDELGGIKLWDIRQNKPAFTFKEHVDYISDMVFNTDKRHLLATSGDGCLSVYDVRKSKPFHVSENQDDELLSVAIMRGGKKVVVGETDGVLGIFTYGQFDDVTDRFPGHPQSIDSICKLTEDMCVTGSSDGLLRIVQLFPHKLVGVAGDHKSLPVEKVVLSYDQQWLASCSHDHTVHFWDIGYIFNDGVSDEDENEDADANGDEQLDAQAIAIQVSKGIVDDEPEIDIDGLSDGSELRVRSDPEGSVDSSDESDDDEVDIVDSDSDSGESDGADSDVKQATIDLPAKPPALASPNGKEEPSDANGNDDASDSDGWGSWSDSDDEDKDSSEKRRKPKPTKAEKQKAKRAALAELANPDKKKRASGASFFADL
ncbi:WD domain repeat-containing protein 55 [Coemansia furcata]|uniref:WD domain repeat-containing protein 55 n=1 Tax=Coemansia furcata TaxID=417177 RepID=A0ACC1LP60_9FUNG|nr:WD domain repeat-containing protein 55 [Coemansia furcata]